MPSFTDDHSELYSDYVYLLTTNSDSTIFNFSGEMAY